MSETVNVNPVAWYFYTANIVFHRPERDAWRMTPRQVWALYGEHMKHEKLISAIRMGALAPRKTTSTENRKATQDEY